LIRELTAARRPLLLGVLAGLVWQGAAVVAPLVLAFAIDRGIATGDDDALVRAAVALVVLTAVQALASAFRHRSAMTAYATSGSRVRTALARDLLEAASRPGTALGPGAAQSLATSDVRAVTVLIDAVAHSVAYAVALIAIACLLAVMHPVLAGVVLGVLAILAATVWLGMRAARSASREVQAAAERTAAAAAPLITAAEVLEGVGARPRHAAAVARASAGQRSAGLAQARLEAWFAAVGDGVPGVALALTALAGGLLVADDALTAGELAAALAYVRLLGPPLNTLPLRILTVQHALAGAERLAAVDGGLPRPLLAAAPIADDERAPSVRVEAAVARAGTRHLLGPVDLEVPPGGLAVLTGPTGAGRTTLLRLLAGERRPEEGDVLVGGDHADVAAMRRRVVLCEAEPMLLHGSVRDVLRLGRPEASDDELWAALAAVQASSVVQALPGGLDASLGERGASLSGGQRLRIGLARALVARPAVLLLDDVTRSLDALTEAAVLRGLRAATGATIVLVSHRPAALAIADVVLRLGERPAGRSGAAAR